MAIKVSDGLTGRTFLWQLEGWSRRPISTETGRSIKKKKRRNPTGSDSYLEGFSLWMHFHPLAKGCFSSPCDKPRNSRILSPGIWDLENLWELAPFKQYWKRNSLVLLSCNSCIRNTSCTFVFGENDLRAVDFCAFLKDLEKDANTHRTRA